MERVKMFFSKDWTLTERILLLVNCVLFGMLLGFLWAPIKRGIYCGNHNGDYHICDWDDCDDEWLDEAD